MADNQAAAADLAGQGLEYTKRVALIVNEADKELWMIVSNVPLLTGPWPYICAILNVVLPGSGTMLAACITESTSWSKTQIFVGILQMLTAIYLIGWIWSIYWAYLLVLKAHTDGPK